MGTSYRELFKLYDLIQSGEARSVEHFLDENTIDVNEILWCKNIGVLHLAVGTEPEDKSRHCTEILLKHGADPNLCNYDGISPVHIAAIWGRVANLKLLLGCGGDPALKDLEGQSAFDYAAKEQQWEVYDYLHNVVDELDDSFSSPCAYSLELEKVLMTTDQMVAEYEPIIDPAAPNQIPTTTVRKSEMVREWCEKSSLVMNKLYPTIMSETYTVDTDSSQWRSVNLNLTNNMTLDLTTDVDNAHNFDETYTTFKTCVSKPVTDIEISGIQKLCITSDESILCQSKKNSDNSELNKPNKQRLSVYENFSLPGSPNSITHRNYNSKSSLKRQKNRSKESSNLKVTPNSSQSLFTDDCSEDLYQALEVSQNHTNERLSSSSQSCKCDTTCLNKCRSYCKHNEEPCTCLKLTKTNPTSNHQVLMNELKEELEIRASLGNKTSSMQEAHKKDLMSKNNSLPHNKDCPANHNSRDSSVICLEPCSNTLKKETQNKVPKTLQKDVRSHEDMTCKTKRTVLTYEDTNCNTRRSCLTHKDTNYNSRRSYLTPEDINCNTRRSSASSGVSSTYSGGSIVIANVEEEYKYEDKDEDVVLIEKRLLVNNVVLPVEEPADSSPDQTIISVASSLPPSVEYDNHTLRAELLRLGFTPGPILDSTRTLYLKKLQMLKRNPIVKTCQGKTYSIELEKSLRCEDWIQNLSPYIELENKARVDFSNPSKKWREGTTKTSFTYLLLDPRLTANLPGKAAKQSNHVSWVTFVNSIFYVGKGKRSRPYSHLYQALELWKRNFTSTKDKKVQHILDIWSDKVGVVCLHIFLNVIPAEAYTYEAAMIDVLGLQNLTNIKTGNYYGTVASWPLKERRMLGLYLLYKAMNIFLSEGERQLRPEDID